MKKTILGIIMFGFLAAAQAYAFIETSSSNDHNMMILREQQFRFQELDTNKDFQEQKQKKLQEDENYVKQIGEKKVLKSLSQPKEFIEENGEIKIKGVE